MTSERSRYGLFVSALGAIVLIVSVFLPWYAGELLAAGAGLAAHHVGQLTGEQALNDMSVILLVLAGLALLDALFPIARAAAVVPDGAGGAVVLLGLLASACVVYRMVEPPAHRRGARAVAARGRMDGAAGLADDLARRAVAAGAAGNRSRRGARLGHLVVADRLDPRRLSRRRCAYGPACSASGRPGSSAMRSRRCSMMRAVAPQMRCSPTT